MTRLATAHRPEREGINMLMKSLDRLEETLDLETSALLARDLSNLEEFNRRKSQCLLEISRIVRTADLTALDDTTTKRLQALRVKIERNQEILQRHMHAVQEVASIISKAVQHAESDSTYSAHLNQARFGA
jgi:galactokinase